MLLTSQADRPVIGGVTEFIRGCRGIVRIVAVTHDASHTTKESGRMRHIRVRASFMVPHGTSHSPHGRASLLRNGERGGGLFYRPHARGHFVSFMTHVRGHASQTWSLFYMIPRRVQVDFCRSSAIGEGQMDRPSAPDHTAWPFVPFAPQDWERIPPAVQAYLRTVQYGLVQLQGLQERVVALEVRHQPEATTSHRPPSSDHPYTKRCRHSTPTIPRKAGGKPGYAGHCHALWPSTALHARCVCGQTAVALTTPYHTHQVPGHWSRRYMPPQGSVSLAHGPEPGLPTTDAWATTRTPNDGHHRPPPTMPPHPDQRRAF